MATTQTATTQQWLEEAQAITSKLMQGSGQGVATPSMLQGLSGLQVLKAMQAGDLPFASIGKTMGFMLISAAEGEAVFQGIPTEAHLNPMGGVHGGWYGTVLDSAMGCAVHTLMPVGRGYTTAEYSINIVRAAKPGVVYRAMGRVLHGGRQLATADARIVDVDGKLYAHATSTCLVFDLPNR
jgi:uncharacterized protein (TIGR00369 family)